MNQPSYKSGLLQVQAYRVLRSKVSQTLDKYDLTTTEWSLLGLIYDRRGLWGSEIALALGVEPPMVTQLVEHLLKRDLVKTQVDSEDRRAKLILLTKKSRVLVPQVEQALTQTLSDILLGVVPEDLLAYQRVLETIVKNA